MESEKIINFNSKFFSRCTDCLNYERLVERSEALSKCPFYANPENCERYVQKKNSNDSKESIPEN